MLACALGILLQQQQPMPPPMAVPPPRLPPPMPQVQLVLVKRGALVVRGRKLAPVAAAEVAVQRGEVGTAAVAGESAGAQRTNSIGRIKDSPALPSCLLCQLELFGQAAGNDSASHAKIKTAHCTY